MSFEAPLTGGELLLNQNCGWEEVCLCESVTGATSASKTLNRKIPAGALITAAGLCFNTAITLATGVRIGLGTSADPDRLALSGTTMTIGTETGPTLIGDPGLIYSNAVASAAISDTAAETAFTFTGETAPSVPANTLKPGDTLRISFNGIATATNSTDTLAIKVYVGSVEVCALAAVDVANNDTFQGYVDVQIRAVGSAGTCVSMCPHSVVGAGKTDGSSAVTWRSEYKASQAIDTTAAQTITVKATWSVQSASNSCRLDTLLVEHKRMGSRMTTAETTLVVSPVSAAGVAAGTFTGEVYAYVWFRKYKSLPNQS